MDYTSSMGPPTLTFSLGLLMLRTVAHVQAATQYKQELLPFETVNKSYHLKQLIKQ